MKKRLPALVLSLILSVALLAGCGSQTEQPTIVPDNSSVEQEISAPSEQQESAEAPGPSMPDTSLETETPAKESEPSQPVEESAKESEPSQSVTNSQPVQTSEPETQFSLADIPAFSGAAYVAVNNNQPYFSADDLTTVSFENYSPLDRLDRCGIAFSCVGKDLMPTEERGSIGMVKPTGWHTVKYDCVNGKYLYNRCHLIGYQLTAENANTSNLITGTRYLNIEGMLPFENMVADYIKETGNHVLYRVTPVFDGDNLVASGVLMEGYSVEDQGSGIEYCVYAYNAQPGVGIDYATGDSWLIDNTPVVPSPPVSKPVPEPAKPEADPEPESSTTQEESEGQMDYILNTNSKKFHYPSCSSVDNMKESNKQEFHGSRDDLISQGYSPCGRCHP